MRNMQTIINVTKFIFGSVALLRLWLLLLVVFSCSLVKAQETIVLGISNDTQGGTSQLGLSLNQGASLFFDEYNQFAKVKISLVQLDDGYEPINTISNTKRMLRDVKPLALFNYVGTPTTSAIMPLLAEFQIPLVTPFTGADFLRDSMKATVFNFRASYQNEAEKQIDYLVNQLKLAKFSLIVQADAFGLSVEKYYLQRLKSYGLVPLVSTRYRRNSVDVERALERILQSKSDAVIVVGTYEPMSKLIQLSRSESYSPIFATLSFVSSFELLKRINQQDKVLVTEVLPNPESCKMAVCEEFRVLARKASWPSVNHVQFEGFLNAKLFSLVANKCSRVDRNCIVEGYRSSRYDLGGLIVEFDDKGNNVAAKVYASQQNLPLEF